MLYWYCVSSSPFLLGCGSLETKEGENNTIRTDLKMLNVQVCVYECGAWICTNAGWIWPILESSLLLLFIILFLLTLSWQKLLGGACL